MTKRIDFRYRKSISERLVYAELLRRESEALGVTHDPVELDKMVEQDRLGARDWEKDKARRGESDESLRRLHVTQLLERAILEQAGKLTVTPEEVDEEYDKVKSSYNLDVDRLALSQIVIEHNEAVSKEEAEAEAKLVYEKARAPDADFSKLAQEHSDVVTRQAGGELGIQRVDRMDPQLANEAAKLKAGQVSRPFESQAGIQLIKVVARWPPGPLPKDALLPQLEGVVFNRKLQAGRDDLKARLATKYAVENRMLASLEPPEK